MTRPFPDALGAPSPYSGIGSDGPKVDEPPTDVINRDDRATGEPSHESEHIVDDSDSSHCMSFDSDSDDEVEDGDGDKTEEPSAEDLQRREEEKRRVLEAAGLIIKHDSSAPPPVPPRRRPSKKRAARAKQLPPRRPIPRVQENELSNLDRALPPVPMSTADPILQADDAFARYEQFKQKQPPTNRFSVTSVDSIPHSLTPSISPVARESDGGKTGSALLSFFGLGFTAPSTSAERRTVNISGPIITAVESNISSENSPTPSFGLVSN